MFVPDGRDPVSAFLGRLGIEIELLAPRGKSREDLALAIADHYGGTVRRFFHPQGEPSKAKNTPFFENLTLGFVVMDAEGEVLAQCVDDLTLQDDLDRRHSPRPGWYRIVSDDARFLRLAMRHADAEAPLKEVLRPVADLFGTEAVEGEGGMIRVADVSGSPVVLGAPLPGERERPCELITPPLDRDHSHCLDTLLGLARNLGFTIPVEGATHIHFDATPLCDAPTLANLVRFLGVHTEALKDRFGTNPRCRRLGNWPVELFECVAAPDFVALEWREARERLARISLTKYCDFNLRNLVHPAPGKHTFEVRILPVWLETERILDAAEFFAAVLWWARDSERELKPIPVDPEDVLRMRLEKR